MTRLEMQERIGAGPYSVECREDESGETFDCHITDAHGGTIALAAVGDECDGTILAGICDALNALWESAK